jgi:hypothetical protein
MFEHVVQIVTYLLLFIMSLSYQDTVWLQIHFRAPDDERCAARNTLSL